MGNLRFWKLSSKTSPLLCPVFPVGIVLSALWVQGASCGFSEHLMAASLDYWGDPRLAFRVTYAAGKSVAFWVFPQLRWHWLPLTSSLGWMKTPEMVIEVWGGGSTWPQGYSLSLRHLLPCSIPLWKRAGRRCPCEDRSHITKDWRVGQYQSVACLGTLALLRILYRIQGEKSNKEQWTESLKMSDFVLLLWFSSNFFF